MRTARESKTWRRRRCICLASSRQPGWKEDRLLRDGAALVLLSILAAAAGCSARSSANGRQVIVIGVDGMDPAFVERHWQDLPNLAELRDGGSFTRLGTTI